LAFQREAEESTFAEMMAPVRDAAGDADDAEVMKLVDTARAAHHAGGRRKRGERAGRPGMRFACPFHLVLSSINAKYAAATGSARNRQP